MSSRALILATVLLLLCAFAPGRSLAQENLDAGKSPSQLFAGTCNVCHKSPRGLLKTVSPSSLPSFLRQHYTTSPNMAGVLASYLVSNGATDTRYGEAAKGAKGAKEGTKEGAKEGAREGTKEGTREAARERQEAARQRSEGEPGTQGHSQANPDHADGRNGAAKQRLSKRGRPEESATPSIEPKSESKSEPKSESKPEPASAETAKPESAKSETASREDGNKSESSKPESSKTEERPSQSAKVEQPPETSAIRPDPVPPVTPAPPSAAESVKAQAPSAAAPPTGTSSPTQASVTPAGTEMAVPLSPTQLPPAPPPAAASTPALPPLPPAGPPAPPISQ